MFYKFVPLFRFFTKKGISAIRCILFCVKLATKCAPADKKEQDDPSATLIFKYRLNA